MTDPHKFMAPGFEVAIAGSRLGTKLSELVESIEYESVDGIADEARLTIMNPDYALSNSPLWQPGNELEIWFGYGHELGHVGRVIIVKPKPTFPESGTPTIQIKGYTKDQLMMRNAPALDKADTRNFEVDLISDAVERVASREAYHFDNLDIDQSPSNRFSSPQKSDMTDYNYIRGLANLLGWLFWVDYDEDTKWTLHFKNPETFHAQDVVYTFEHNRGNNSTLLSFDPELSLEGAVTKLQVQSRNPDTDESFIEEFTEDLDAPDSKYKGDPKKTIDEEHTTAGAVVKMFFGDYAIEIVSDKKFQSAAEMKLWAQQWFRRRREGFVTGRGTVIGVDTLRARQTHKLVLPSTALCGDYYFARVAHKFDSTSGYIVDFNARKVFK